MEELEQTVARIDENVRLLREDLGPLKITVDEHSQVLSAFKQDKVWGKGIVTVLMGLIGVVLGALCEFLRK